MTLSYDDVVAKYEPVLGLEVHVEPGWTKAVGAPA
jgi:hypothetical protein